MFILLQDVTSREEKRSDSYDVVLGNEEEDGRPQWATRKFINKENIFEAVSHGGPFSLLHKIIPFEAIEAKDQTEGLKFYFLSATVEAFIGVNKKELTCMMGCAIKSISPIFKIEILIYHS